ncbi:DUF4190 domain-containing protein [Aeromicrobium sp. CF3.5]|uniref:DUF4190 domain-containing protein n=1 Tax=Aeromicrobium sp. CF3.5 TaxID=3373078 RepID=UPI003EE6E7E3
MSDQQQWAAPPTDTPPPGWYQHPAPVHLPQHPRANAALALGIISVCGLVVGVTLVVGPLAWYYGAAAMRDIDREPTRWSGRGTAKAGFILGIIGTGLLALAMLLLLVVIGGLAIVSGFDSGYPT